MPNCGELTSRESFGLLNKISESNFQVASTRTAHIVPHLIHEQQQPASRARHTGLQRSMASQGSISVRARLRAIRKVQQSLDYLRQNLDKPLRISTLSAMAGLSASHFFFLFKSLTGYAPVEFFNRLRISHACDLLRHTTLLVKEVAGCLGYRDQFYFSRVFKSITGVAPRAYRIAARNHRSKQSLNPNHNLEIQ